MSETEKTCEESLSVIYAIDTQFIDSCFWTICTNLSIYLPIMSNPFWGPRHMRVKLHIVNPST